MSALRLLKSRPSSSSQSDSSPSSVAGSISGDGHSGNVSVASNAPGKLNDRAGLETFGLVHEHEFVMILRSDGYSLSVR